LAVGPAGILPAEENYQPGETPGCPTGKMPVLQASAPSANARQHQQSRPEIYKDTVCQCKSAGLAAVTHLKGATVPLQGDRSRNSELQFGSGRNSQCAGGVSIP
jgi:hypothetical protein